MGKFLKNPITEERIPRKSKGVCKRSNRKENSDKIIEKHEKVCVDF